jgi:hypothetical protein
MNPPWEEGDPFPDERKARRRLRGGQPREIDGLLRAPMLTGVPRKAHVRPIRSPLSSPFGHPKLVSKQDAAGLYRPGFQEGEGRPLGIGGEQRPPPSQDSGV